MALEFYTYNSTKRVLIPYFDTKVNAGFPSPAQDYSELTIDLNEHLIQHPASTFIVRVNGDSLKDEGIDNNSILVVDRSEPYKKGAIAIVNIDNEFTIKKIERREGKYYLVGANKTFQPILINEDIELFIWGIVTWVLNPKY